MRPPRLRAAMPWVFGLSLVACLSCLALAVYLGLAAKTDARERAARQLAAQADGLTRQIEGDLALFDLTLRESSRLLTPRDAGSASTIELLNLPLTSHYIGFINVLNEVGDVVADPRSNVSRPVNFAGRDYFQDHLKNPAEIVMIGRPFATAPNQHASIPISLRLDRPDGGFAGVVVAGVRLAWLSDLLSRPSPGLRSMVTIRRDDGLILMREPFDANAIGHGGETDPAWRTWLRTGASPAADGVMLFRRVGLSPLVIELEIAQSDIVNGQMTWLLVLTLVPGICALGLGVAAHRLRRRGMRVDAAARAANDERMRLLATMSHELRTPLTGVLGQAELMTDEGGLSDHQMERLTRLTEAGTLMRDVIDRVIDISAPDDIAETPILTACDLDPLIRTCLGVVEGEARRKGVLLTSAVDPATPRRALLERDRVQQMLINLLMNAVKFTAQGTVSLRVTGHAAALRFEVADTGPGIPAGKRRRLFRAYDRLDAPPSGAGGTGLGLSITERFVRRLGGRIGHRENPGGGSVFWIELPITRPGPLVAALPSENMPPKPPPTMRHLTVLLADDLELTRAVTAEFLRSAGHTVVETSGGETAITEAQTRDFDVMLTDMRMPVIDGLEVTRRIRAVPGPRGRTPIVLVTADLVALAAGASGETGVDGCLRKPFTRGELLAAVTTAAGLKPAPATIGSTNPVLDATALGELRRSLGEEPFAMHLDAAARRIEDLHALLDSPEAADNRVVRDAVHDLIGVAGLLGLTELSACLRRFDLAEGRTAAAALLHDAATAAGRALRRHQVPAVSSH